MGSPFTVRDVLRWTKGDLLAGASEVQFDATSIDTRTVAPGALFVAIVGEKHDAHSFLDKAVAAGAAGLLVDIAVALVVETIAD